MGLFNVRQLLSTKVRLNIDADPEVFYELGEGYALFQKGVKRGSLVKGPRIPLSCMFEVYWLMKKDERVGYYFISQFQTVNHGGYLATYMNAGAGKATAVEVMLKTDQLVVYHYPNKGTLVISTKVNDEMKTVLEEQ